MEQYIPKSVVLAEIKRLRKAHSGKHGCDEVGLNLEYLEDFLDTLEGKEVDLKEEIDDFMAKEWEGIEEEDEPFYGMIKNDLASVAKHFFELGMKTAQEGK